MTDADRAVIEQARGALMLCYGIGSHLALASLARSAHEANTPLYTFARALMRNISHGDQTEFRDPVLVSWLEERLRQSIPEAAVPAQRLPRRHDP